MSAQDALHVLEYLGRNPETADVCDVQLSRLIQVVQALTGKPKDFEDIRLRGRYTETPEEQAENWLRYLDERNKSDA